jgi:hypothetical protein
VWPFGNLMAIWYIFPRFGILCQEKSGNLAEAEENMFFEKSNLLLLNSSRIFFPSQFWTVKSSFFRENETKKNVEENGNDC